MSKPKKVAGLYSLLSCSQIFSAESHDGFEIIREKLIKAHAIKPEVTGETLRAWLVYTAKETNKIYTAETEKQFFEILRRNDILDPSRNETDAALIAQHIEHELKKELAESKGHKRNVLRTQMHDLSYLLGVILATTAFIATSMLLNQIHIFAKISSLFPRQETVLCDPQPINNLRPGGAYCQKKTTPTDIPVLSPVEKIFWSPLRHAILFVVIIIAWDIGILSFHRKIRRYAHIKSLMSRIKSRTIFYAVLTSLCFAFHLTAFATESIPNIHELFFTFGFLAFTYIAYRARKSILAE